MPSRSPSTIEAPDARARIARAVRAARRRLAAPQPRAQRGRQRARSRRHLARAQQRSRPRGARRYPLAERHRAHRRRDAARRALPAPPEPAARGADRQRRSDRREDQGSAARGSHPRRSDRPRAEARARETFVDRLHVRRSAGDGSGRDSMSAPSSTRCATTPHRGSSARAVRTWRSSCCALDLVDEMCLTTSPKLVGGAVPGARHRAARRAGTRTRPAAGRRRRIDLRALVPDRLERFEHARYARSLSERGRASRRIAPSQRARS